jgi:hypothetical protein
LIEINNIIDSTKHTSFLDLPRTRKKTLNIAAAFEIEPKVTFEVCHWNLMCYNSSFSFTKHASFLDLPRTRRKTLDIVVFFMIESLTLLHLKVAIGT